MESSINQSDHPPEVSQLFLVKHYVYSFRLVRFPVGARNFCVWFDMFCSAPLPCNMFRSAVPVFYHKSSVSLVKGVYVIKSNNNNNNNNTLIYYILAWRTFVLCSWGMWVRKCSSTESNMKLMLQLKVSFCGNLSSINHLGNINILSSFHLNSALLS
jgi:hypothetical protein